MHILSPFDYLLLEQAATVRNNAQAPYSHYHVGAAVRSNSHGIYKGCNVERCSYTQTTHAEQNAIDTMIAHEGPSKIQALAIIAAPADTHISTDGIESYTCNYTPPPGASCCGHCLQIIWENCLNDSTIPIYFLNTDKKIYITTIGTLLPYPFGPHDIHIDYRKNMPRDRVTNL